mgnify:CR=1 FL=1
MSVIVPALLHIPREARAEAVRLLRVTQGSGAGPWMALLTAYRFTHGREHYREIHAGLEDFFKEMAGLEK